MQRRSAWAADCCRDFSLDRFCEQVNQFTNGGGFTGGNYFTIARAGEKEPERVEIEQELSNQARMVEAFSNIVLGARTGPRTSPGSYLSAARRCCALVDLPL